MAAVSTPDRDAVSHAARSSSRSIDAVLARFGIWLRDHQNMIRRLQWALVGAYVLLLVVPAVLPLPQGAAHIWNNVTLFAQFVFWGLWWPFVLVSMVLVGRLWCGLLCPEGALSERAAEHGRGGAIPHWLQWKGWPFVAFVLTTIYGQMTSVYQYPGPGAGGARRLDPRGDRRRLAVGPQQAGLVPFPVPGQWRVQPAGQAGAFPFPRRSRRLGAFPEIARRSFRSR